MPHTVEWLIQGRIIAVQVNGNITLQDVADIDQKTIALLDSAQTTVHIIADLEALGKFPFDVIGMRRTATYLQHPQLGLIVAYGTSYIASTFAQLLTQLAGVRLHFARNRDEALKRLMAEDAALTTPIKQHRLLETP